MATLGTSLGADKLDATLVQFGPGQATEPFHFAHGREEWLLVLAGSPSLQRPQGVEEQLDADDLVCLHEGPAGGYRLVNRRDSDVWALVLSTTGLPVAVCYPDTGHWVVRSGGDDIVLREPGCPDSRT